MSFKVLFYLLILLPVNTNLKPAVSWNPDGSVKVLGVPGWLDNAGTFTNLVRLLPTSYHIVAIDLPGHGLSSHYPAGATLSLLDYCSAAKRVIDFLEWNKCYIISHSMGNSVSFYLNAIFPENVDKIVALDQINTLPAETDELVEFRRRALTMSLEMERGNNDKIKSYSMDSLVKSLLASSKASMKPESAKILLARSVTKIGEDSYTLNRDWRYRKFRYYVFLTRDEQITYSSGVKAEILHFRFTKGVGFDYGEGLFEYYPKNAKSFMEIKLDGGHHLHLDNPELIAPHVINFFGNV